MLRGYSAKKILGWTMLMLSLGCSERNVKQVMPGSTIFSAKIIAKKTAVNVAQSIFSGNIYLRDKSGVRARKIVVFVHDTVLHSSLGIWLEMSLQIVVFFVLTVWLFSPSVVSSLSHCISITISGLSRFFHPGLDKGTKPYEMLILLLSTHRPTQSTV